MQIVKLKSGLGLNVLTLNPEGAETVIMIHGMFGNLSHFYLTIAPHFAANYKVVLFDLKSQGKSEKRDTGYDVQTFAEEVIELADALGIQKAHLLGYSFGCLVALKCAMDYPERVGKVIAIEVPDKAVEPCIPKGQYTYEHFEHFVRYLNTNVRDNFFHNRRHLMNTFKMHEYIHNHTSFPEDFDREKEFDQSDFDRISSPVLLAFGIESVCMREFHRIKTMIPFMDYCLENGGHAFFSSDPAYYAAKMVNFLESDKPFLNPFRQTLPQQSLPESLPETA